MSYMIKAIIKISRPVNFLITFFAVVITGLISAKSSSIGFEIVYAAFAMAFACSAGNVFNDIADIEIDRINKPDRVLAKGIISINFAKVLYAIFIVLSFLSAFYFGIESFIYLAVINLILIFYSTHLKKIVLIGNFTVALLTASALIYGAEIAGNINAGIIPALFAFFTNLIREIIKDMEDVVGDSTYDIFTFPKIYGYKRTVFLIFVLTFIIVFFTIGLYLYNIYKIEFFLILMVIVNPLFIFMLKLLYKSQNQDTLKKAGRIIKLNMVIGLIAIYIGS